MTIQSLFLLLVVTFFTKVSTMNISNRTKIKLPLIHQNSILSPFFSTAKLSTFSYENDDIRSPVLSDERSTSFFVNVSIGSPPVPQLLVMDTGSPLTWVCTKCNPSLNAVYNSMASSTYKDVSCVSRYQCLDYYDSADCTQDSQCSYTVTYEDESSSRGLLATEKFTFATSTGGIVEVTDVGLGCGSDNQGNALNLTGILGLEPLNEHSLVSRVSNKFSYCVGNISDPNYMFNQLILGEGAIMEGDYTPMRIEHGHYSVKLEGVSVGEKKLDDINQQEFDYNVIIDSGTTLTYFRRNVFDRLKKEIIFLMEGIMELVEVRNSGERLCYKGNLDRDLIGFPVVTLHFSEGAELNIEVEGMFQRVNDDTFCMAVDVSKTDKNIVGAYAQQYYNLGFDLNAGKISIQRIECELLED